MSGIRGKFVKFKTDLAGAITLQVVYKNILIPLVKAAQCKNGRYYWRYTTFKLHFCLSRKLKIARILIISFEVYIMIKCRRKQKCDCKR